MLDLRDPGLLNTDAFLGGTFVPADDGRRTPVVDPATGQLLGEVPRLGAAETLRAIETAERALPSWRRLPAPERGKVLARLATLVERHREDLALLLTSEQGKPLAEARGEIDYANSFTWFYAEESKRLYGDLVPAARTDQKLLVQPEPIGVCAAITPWNFPQAMVTRKLAPALAAGNAVILKPAEATPLSALALAKLAKDAGVPDGILSVLTGAREDAERIGGTLLRDARVRKISFTGSTAVGKQLYAGCAGTVKRLSLELGGNAPFVVFDDADLDAAVDGLLVAKFRNAGQTCVAANRILVQRSVFDAFVARLEDRIRGLVVGPGTAPNVQIGPLIDGRGLAKVEAHVADALARGGEVVTGGKRHALGRTFFEPTLLVGVTADSAMSCEETFGPVAGLCRFDTEEEAVRLANDTPYGLAAYFFARDVGRIHRVADALESGMVGVNTGLVSNASAPFGGVKESGLGREGSHYGIDEWVERKYVCLGGLG
ncbi:MAG: NAD-dependent succinate-semialdehyde dehydrogenase [Polyangiales bacterium]